MSTPLTDSINALTAYANETTGASDTTLSDAVGRLCDGYGGGSELYPVGTDLIAFYGLRDWTNGRGYFVHGTFTEDGEMTQTDDAKNSYLCMKYLEINPSYEYTKNNNRIIKGFYYDKDKNFISNFVLNNATWMKIDTPPQNAKFFRFATSYLDSNLIFAIFRTA
jgi:hypothetical protein